MKSILLSFLILAILSKVVRPTYDDNGYDNLTIASNDDPNSCLIFLNLTINPKKITFYATVIQNDNSDCTHHDLQFMSSFRGDNITGQVTLVPTEDNANVSTGDLTLDNVTKYNGTACLYSGYQVDNGTIFYGCQFKYNDVMFVLDFGLDPVTGDFATDNWINLFNPYLGVNKVVNQNNISVWRANTSFPQIVGMLYKQCGSWSSIINSLSTELTITGTELQSNTLNLTQFWSNYTFNSMWIRRKEVLTSNLTYYAYKPDFDWFAFNNTSGGNCSDTGLTYARILNDLEFCKNGCDFSAFVILNHSIALLQTGGFATQP